MSEKERSNKMAASVSIKRAAEILGLSPISVQCALRVGALPIGSAWKNENSTTWKYHVSPKLLSEYSGVSEEEIRREP